MPKYSTPINPIRAARPIPPQDGAQMLSAASTTKSKRSTAARTSSGRSIDDIVSDLAGVGAGVGAELLDGLAGVITSAGTPSPAGRRKIRI